MERWLETVTRRASTWLAILGGSRPTPRRGWLTAVALGVWWTLLFAAVFATIGRATKFIYVDF
jgi:hypothetical protein